ncbi:Ankyrin repeat-containing protein [Micromonospora pallida]|uniref:Ankyrin repeat-containing protein n=1 Tax=Micromonospora pallida TaxID=145854 RepID=A0A1C6SG79_9ACTN|nr:ankyrin repeat domain-containing protein [Micromonospora pallida]SCL28437.1 Ankyrin repeat-containing protein [Micromonospora pallida]
MNSPVIDEIRTWQRVRRYAVPAAMVEASTAAREAGDWRAACAAARIDVAFDLTEVAREHGRARAGRIEADLGVLAPDLLRWHLPRVLGGRTGVATHQRFVLSTWDKRFGKNDVALVVDTPKTVDGSQRLRLTVRPALGENHQPQDLPPVYWSAAHVDGLAGAYDGSPVRLPGFAPDGTRRPFESYATVVDPGDPASRAEVFDRLIAGGETIAAWAVAGVDLDPEVPESYYLDLEVKKVARGCLVPLGLGAELTRLHTRYGVDQVMIWSGGRLVAEVRRQRRGPVAAAFVGYDQERYRRSRFAGVVHERPVDLDLLRLGLLGPAELHPLVRRALFPVSAPTMDDKVPPGDGQLATGTVRPRAAGPEAVQPGASRAAASRPATAPPEAGGLRVEARVRCGGDWHTLVHGDGRLDPVSHTSEEVAGEELLRALGGRSAGCFAAVQAWQGGDGRLPRILRALRRDVLLRIQHGGATAMTALLDAGLDPRMGDGRGGTLLHHLRAVGDVSLVRRLADAGVPIMAGNRRGRTALHVAVGDGGSPELVHALLAAGADPHAPDGDDLTPFDLADGKAGMYDDDSEDGQPVLRIRDVLTEWVRR